LVSNPPYQRISTELGVVYNEVEGTKLCMDAHIPEGEGPFPGIILIHGGGWRNGARSAVTDRCIFYASQGFASFTVSYRLSPEFKFPAHIHDVKAAIRYVRENASELNTDPERLAAVGFSAGAHLASLAGVTGEKDGLEGPDVPYATSTRVQAVVSYFGPTDLRGEFNRDGTEVPTVIADFLGGTREEIPEVYDQASPMTFVSPDAPPFMFVHGMEDAVVPYEQSVMMVEALKKVGVTAELVGIEGGGHGAMPWEAEVRPKVLAFLEEHLRAKG